MGVPALSRMTGRSEPYGLPAIVLLSLLIQLRSGQFLTGNNLVDLARAMIVPGLFSIGAMMVIVSGGIDVSFTAIASLAMYLTDRILLAQDYSGTVLLAYAMAAGFGLVMGALNGFLIGFLRLPTLVVTLGTASLFTGLMQGVFGASASAVPPALDRTARRPFHRGQHAARAVLEHALHDPHPGRRAPPRVPAAALHHARPRHLRHRRRRDVGAAGRVQRGAGSRCSSTASSARWPGSRGSPASR